MEINATRMCALLVGLPDVTVLAVDDCPGEPIRVHVEQRVDRPRCAECEMVAWVKDRLPVELVDLGCFGRPARLVWHKQRWCCPSRSCPAGSWTGQDTRIAAARLAMTDRAGRWVTAQVGRHGRTVAEVARELGCDWHTVNDAVMAYGTPLVEDPDRIGDVTAVGLDEVRRRVQNETLGHRGRKHDPLYRSRRLLTRADERLDERGRTKLVGLLDAGDPRGEVRTAWHAKEVVRSIYVSRSSRRRSPPRSASRPPV